MTSGPHNLLGHFTGKDMFIDLETEQQEDQSLPCGQMKNNDGLFDKTCLAFARGAIPKQ